MNKKQCKIMALFVCIVFVWNLFVYIFFVATETEHVCTGEDCPICACLNQVERVIRTVGNGVPEMVVCALLITLCVCKIFISITKIPVISLVSQKVRLDD